VVPDSICAQNHKCQVRAEYSGQPDTHVSG
jgi:hypothetical protein